MGREFTVENNKQLLSSGYMEEYLLQRLRRINIDSTRDVSTFILVLETTVHNHEFVVFFFVFTIHNLAEGCLVNASQGVILAAEAWEN